MFSHLTRFNSNKSILKTDMPFSQSQKQVTYRIQPLFRVARRFTFNELKKILCAKLNI